MQQYENSINTIKEFQLKNKEKSNKKLGNKNGKKNNCMDTSSDKLGRLHMWRPGYGPEKETSREKLNFS